MQRLSGLDASFLALERDGTLMHVGSVLVFEGPAPLRTVLLEHLAGRLALVPNYRRRVAFPPLGGRPVWVDDTGFALEHHVRRAALADGAGVAALRELAGVVFSIPLDRARPLWEIVVVERVRLRGKRHFALICKTHHALVDGIADVDLTTVLLDSRPEPDAAATAQGAALAAAWRPAAAPGRTQLLGGTLQHRLDLPGRVARRAVRAVEDPERTATGAGRAISGVAAQLAAGISGAPPSALNVRIGPRRRFAWADADLERYRAVKAALGGTVNDVVLTVVAGALRGHLARTGHDPDTHPDLKALVPVSVRTADERGALGNRLTGLYAPLPVAIGDPVERFGVVHRAVGDLRASGRAVDAQAISRLAGFAAPTLLTQAARLQARQRFFNLAVTNVPGPQAPLYLLGARLSAAYPQVPLTLNTALGVAVLSYAGRLGYGVVGDRDTIGDELDAFARDLGRAFTALERAALAT